MKIYLDLVVILNFLVDFLLLLGTSRLSGFPASPLRAAAAAALGAVYSGVCMMPRMRFLGGLLWRIVSLAGMAVIAFGWDKKRMEAQRRVRASQYGAGRRVAEHRPGIFTDASAYRRRRVGAVHRGLRRTGGGREYVPVELTYGEKKTVSIVALRDSGNTLRDPVSGEQVLVVSRGGGGKD